MGKVLLLCAIAELGVMILLLLDRYRLERLRYELVICVLRLRPATWIDDRLLKERM